MQSVYASIEWSRGIEDAWADVSSFVPKLVGFLLVLLIGYFIVKLISKAVDKVLDKVGFDKAVERGAVAKAMSKSKYDASDLISKLVFYTLFLFVLQAAFGVFGENPISDLLGDVIAYLPKLIAAIIIVVVASAIAAAVREIVQASLGGLSYGNALASVAAIAILALGVFAALNQLQIAEPIVNGLFYAIVGTLAGIAIIAVGGGGVRPMQSRWEKSLQRYDAEKPKLKQEAAGSKERIAERAQERKEQAGGSN